MALGASAKELVGPYPPSNLIHRSACNRNSRKFTKNIGISLICVMRSIGKLC